MYLARHKNKFIKSAKTPQGRRPPVIDFRMRLSRCMSDGRAKKRG